MNKTLVKLSDAQKYFGDTHVLKDISLEIKEGEVTSLIGPSGAGKSSLLRVLSLLEYIDSGSLWYGQYAVCTDIDGLARYDEKACTESKELFGLVFQQFNLFPHFSVLENITNPLTVVKKFSKSDARNKAHDVLKKLNLQDKVKAYPHELSGGQKQRLAIARALAMEPKVLYFDEPTSALDKNLVSELADTINDLKADNLAMLIVSHDLDFAAGVADNICFMSEGRIIEQGPKEEVLKNSKDLRTKDFIA